MRNTTNMIVSQADTAPAVEETTWAWPGAVVGFISWLLALGVPFLLYGSNTLFFLLYTWPFFLALMPVAVVVGVAVFSLLERKLVYSTLATLISVGMMFGLLFIWLAS
ncbi:hypothetical protein AFK62_15675 [Cronobacter condimenti 1330]|uniref:Cytochrome oxidase subunit n=2 Tax=Cronobacter condimenti 1330 TaxID=1073999 RepID=A0ABM5VFA5_9ENTR|nr:DUF3561 family protein [Cronobacter condimenti]ALB63845.1 hypothetical protein AFK62_15675 [Cronobacter condimenti 1330]